MPESERPLGVAPTGTDGERCLGRERCLLKELHLVLGDYAASALEAARRDHGLPGSVFAIPDDLSHGPLHDGRARIAYMRACYRGFDDWTFVVEDAFAPWRVLAAALDGGAFDAVVVWSGDSPSEGVLLRMACWWRRERAEPLFRVAMPGDGDRHYVSLYGPEALAALLASRRPLEPAERDALAADFSCIRDAAHLLRRWVDGRIITVPTAHYDPLLLAACSRDWLPAARVVGNAMARCDPHNRISDLFFCSRLQVLIDAGRVVADGDRPRMRDYAVRLA
jgi:hypothetical protein